MKPLIFHDEAERELRETAFYYETQQPGLGKRWSAELRLETQKIRANPTIGRRVVFIARQYRLKSFPYFIVFQNRPDDVYILAIAHVRRRPDYWIDRLDYNEP